MKARLVILSTFVEKLLAFGESQGLDAQKMKSAARLNAHTDFTAESWISIDNSMKLWEYLVRQLDDPGVPIHVAKTSTMEDYQALGLFASVCRDLSEVMNRFRRHTNFYTNSGSWDVRNDGAETTLIWRRDLPLDIGHRVANENGLAEVVNTARQLAGPSFNPTRVTFRHRAPRSIEAHQAYFNALILFDSVIDSISFSSEWLSVPMSQSNPAVVAFLDKYLGEIITHLEDPSCWSNRVREMILKELPSGVFSAAVIAKKLALSERSLRRYLSAEGATFRALLANVRHERAEYLLQETSIPISEIAFMLGYSDITSFSRAFRRQAGLSPREVRQRNL